jgi:hypothetical protein
MTKKSSCVCTPSFLGPIIKRQLGMLAATGRAHTHGEMWPSQMWAPKIPP